MAKEYDEYAASNQWNQPNEWVDVARSAVNENVTVVEVTERLPVPNGWLYRWTAYDDIHGDEKPILVSMVFVPSRI